MVSLNLVLAGKWSDCSDRFSVGKSTDQRMNSRESSRNVACPLFSPSIPTPSPFSTEQNQVQCEMNSISHPVGGGAKLSSTPAVHQPGVVGLPVPERTGSPVIELQTWKPPTARDSSVFGRRRMSSHVCGTGSWGRRSRPVARTARRLPSSPLRVARSFARRTTLPSPKPRTQRREPEGNPAVAVARKTGVKRPDCRRARSSNTVYIRGTP